MDWHSSRNARRLTAALVVATALAVALPASAHPPVPRQVVPSLPVQQALEPPLTPTPQARCGRGSQPETDLQGRVSRADHESGRAAAGYTCNTEVVSSYEKPNVFGTVGGFKVQRYVDDAGRECAYYDTTLLHPTNIFDGEGGVNVINLSHPSHPVLTDRLATPAMLSPHESLVVNKKRGLLAAVLGSPSTNLGIVDVYDLSGDCRHPILRSSLASAALGHESGMALDGRTFYAASVSFGLMTAVDLSNPSLTRPLWYGYYDSHGLELSDDGDRAYVAATGSGLLILDTTEIQDRVPNPQVREIARLEWDGMSIPQNAIPVTIGGHPYVVETDEFGTLDEVGAARIIDIAEERQPRVISNMRLEVHQPENFDHIAGDPGAANPVQGYAAHYCNVPRRVDPGIVACGMLLSGLRVFDIRDPRHPREIAYFNAPIKPRSTALEASNWAMAQPAFAPERGEIWYTDAFQGFFVVRVTNGMWPFPKCMGIESNWPTVDRRTVGTRVQNVIVGARGSDRINARGGADRVCAKGGRDKLSGGRGRDRLRGGPGNDRLAAGPGRDTLACGAGRRDVAIADPRDRVDGCETVK